jgi:antitoxin PrlF
MLTVTSQALKNSTAQVIDKVMQLHYLLKIPSPAPETAMTATLEVESTLTDRYQTTVPETVRRALKLGKRDKIHYTILPEGGVVITRAAPTEPDDPVLSQFLGFLAQDMANQPQQIQAVTVDWAAHLQSLVGDIEVDFDASLSPDAG